MTDSKADDIRREVAKILGVEPIRDADGNWAWSTAGKPVVVLRPDPLYLIIEPNFPGTPDQHQKLRDLCIDRDVRSSFGDGTGLRT